METLSILSRRISICRNCHSNSYNTITLFDALNAIRTNVYKTSIDTIRNLYEQKNYAGCRAKKKRLPAYLFTGILFDTRHKFDVSGYTFLLIIDIDNLDDVEATKTTLKTDPHIISIWKSPSGHGLKLLFYLEYDIENDTDLWIIHEHCAFPQVCNYIFERYNISADKTGGDITRLCFVSSDPEIHLKREFSPFQVSVTLNRNQINHIRNKYLNGSKHIKQRVTKMKNLSTLTFPTSPFEPVDEHNLSKINNLLFQIRLSITRVNYELTDQLINSLRDILDNLNNTNSHEQPMIKYHKHLTEICEFTDYLKTSQQTLIETNTQLTHRKFNLPVSYTKDAINNLKKSIRFKQLLNLIKEYNHDSRSENFTQIKAEIEEIILHGFRGAGCSAIRKWAKHEYLAIMSKA